MSKDNPSSGGRQPPYPIWNDLLRWLKFIFISLSGKKRKPKVHKGNVIMKQYQGQGQRHANKQDQRQNTHHKSPLRVSRHFENVAMECSLYELQDRMQIFNALVESHAYATFQATGEPTNPAAGVAQNPASGLRDEDDERENEIHLLPWELDHGEKAPKSAASFQAVLKRQRVIFSRLGMRHFRHQLLLGQIVSASNSRDGELGFLNVDYVDNIRTLVVEEAARYREGSLHGGGQQTLELVEMADELKEAAETMQKERARYFESARLELLEGTFPYCFGATSQIEFLRTFWRILHCKAQQGDADWNSEALPAKLWTHCQRRSEETGEDLGKLLLDLIESEYARMKRAGSFKGITSYNGLRRMIDQLPGGKKPEAVTLAMFELWTALPSGPGDVIPHLAYSGKTEVTLTWNKRQQRFVGKINPDLSGLQNLATSSRAKEICDELESYAKNEKFLRALASLSTEDRKDSVPVHQWLSHIQGDASKSTNMVSIAPDCIKDMENYAQFQSLAKEVSEKPPGEKQKWEAKAAAGDGAQWREMTKLEIDLKRKVADFRSLQRQLEWKIAIAEELAGYQKAYIFSGSKGDMRRCTTEDVARLLKERYPAFGLDRRQLDRLMESLTLSVTDYGSYRAAELKDQSGSRQDLPRIKGKLSAHQYRHGIKHFFRLYGLTLTPKQIITKQIGSQGDLSSMKIQSRTLRKYIKEARREYVVDEVMKSGA